MKKIALSILIIFCGQLVFSQIKTDSDKRKTATQPTVVNQSRIIPSSRATLIRKDMIRLNLELNQLSDSIAITKKDMDEQVKKMKNDLDSMSEMGEMESLRLQMAMDRLSKMMSTLSNLLKKISNTANGITQNIK